MELTNKDGGATILRNGSLASEGFAVGGIMEFNYFQADKSPEKLASYVLDAVACIEECTACDAFGFWIHNSSMYIDAINIFQNESEALSFARKNNEIAIFDLNTSSEIRC